ncbi:MAG: Mu-like prophage major head subunit gpT family protein [Pseudomonadota bacterium]
MSNINTATFAKALKPGVKKWFGMAYKEIPLQCSMVFNIETSDEAYEDDVEATSFGLAAQKTEAGSVLYDAVSQGGTSRYLHATFGLGYKISLEAIEDNKYDKLAKSYSRNLAFSMRQTKEVVHANILNRGFNSSYTGYDGSPLFATDHATTAGNQANKAATDAALSEAALEDLCILIRKAENSRGLKIHLRPKMLVVPPDSEFEAHRILKSSLRVGTDFNDTNALRDMQMFPEGAMTYDYLTDTNSWFVKTTAPTGLTGYQRRALTVTNDNEHDTDNACFKATERYSAGWSDFRGVYGSDGDA